MSSDYRPRGGGSGAGSSGGRRRRGGRGRGTQHGAPRSHSNGHGNGTSASAPKKKNPIAQLFGWVFGKKSSKPAAKPAREVSSRPESRERDTRPERPRREDHPKADATPQEIVTPKLYVGNLSYEAGESDLFDLFSKVGAVKNVEIAMDRHSNRSKGFGFVEMEALETAKEASAKLNRTDFMGRQIVVSGAKLDKRPAAGSRETAEPSPDSTI